MTTIETAPRAAWRERLRWPLMLLGVAAAAAVAVWLYLSGGRREDTDDAYVRCAQVAISADVGGRVLQVDVHDNERVHRGQVLYRLDDAPYRIALAAAQARLAAARVQLRVLRADVGRARAELAAAGNAGHFAELTLVRTQQLARATIASQAQLEDAERAQQQAARSVAAARAQLDAARAALGGSAARNPQLREAAAALAQARLDLAHTVVRAPADGVVTRVDALQPGRYMAAATPAFALLRTDQVWIEADFKEDQLAHMRVGDAAQVSVDALPGRVLRGQVTSFSPGTGAVFSLLPPENASGNWVKVVQRLPVRIALDAPPPELRSGLSAEVVVDTGWRRHLFGGGRARAARGGTP
jgi:membrane fusion protein (multidrug efflux system)